MTLVIGAVALILTLNVAEPFPPTLPVYRIVAFGVLYETREQSLLSDSTRSNEPFVVHLIINGMTALLAVELLLMRETWMVYT